MTVSASVRATSRWLTRIIPCVLAAAVGFASYVVIRRVCIDYLLNIRGEDGVTIAILILYFLSLTMMVWSYLRTIVIITFDTGLIPLGPLAANRRQTEKERKKAKKALREGDLEAQPYYPGPDPNPDSPGLEQFYTKDIFVCDSDGRPKWCSECCNWKLDRAHHSSEINRCVVRMDHYCPWAGGMVAENSYKFFAQFVFYTTLFCGVVMGATGYTLKLQSDGYGSPDPFVIAVIVLGGFFGLFTSLMTMVSLRYNFMNMTNVDEVKSRSQVYQLAVRVPNGTYPTDKFTTINYPLSKPSWTPNGQLDGAYSNVEMRSREDEPRTARDQAAQRTFAILRTQVGENPWDLGFYNNWKSVMGTNLIDWLLPVRRSPFTNHEDTRSFYPMGRVVSDVLERYGLREVPDAQQDGQEMQEVRGI